MKTDILKKTWVGEKLLRRTPVIYGYYRRILADMEQADREVRQNFWNRQKARLQKKAHRLPGYRAASKESWPVLEKETLRSAPESFFAKTIWPCASAATSGTTGIPLKLRRSWNAVVVEQAALDHLAAKAGLDLGKARMAIFRGDHFKNPSDMSPPFWEERAGGRILACSSNHLCAGTIDAYVQALHDFGPEALWVYPSALEALCRLWPQNRQTPQTLKVVLSSSEVLRPDVRQWAENRLHIPVYDYYGQAERLVFAYGTEADRYYFHPAYGITELRKVREEDSEDYYEIIGTPLWNNAQILLRYRTGDLARLPRGLSENEVQETALGLRPFYGVEGREEDYLLSPDGVRLIGMNHIPQNLNGVAQMQLVQTAPDKVDVWLVTTPDYTPETEKQLLRQARLKIPESMTLTVHKTDRLERTKQGKLPLIVRKI